MCDICRKPAGDPVELGDLMKLRNISVHYYCLLLSTKLPQKGEDTGGILGFLVKDIKQEIEAASKRICVYCTERHASIKCHRCKNYFHLVCGLENDCLFQFADEFTSFCKKHTKIERSEIHTPLHGCYICLEKMGDYNPVTSIASACCNQGWVHRHCLKKYALTSGYYLKCLWCTHSSFRNYVRNLGIFVPDRDALWEKDKKAYAGLYENYSTCDATICFCEKGRKHSSRFGKWKISICSHCGSFGTHAYCKVDESEDDFICKTCLPILEYVKRKHKHVSNEHTSLFDNTLYQTKSLALNPYNDAEGSYSNKLNINNKQSMFSFCTESINYNFINNLKDISNLEPTYEYDSTLRNIVPESQNLPDNESDDIVTKATVLMDLNNGQLLGFRHRKMKKSEEYIKYLTEEELKKEKESENKFTGFTCNEIDFDLLDKIVEKIKSSKIEEPKEPTRIDNVPEPTKRKKLSKEKDYLMGIYFDRFDPKAEEPSFNV